MLETGNKMANTIVHKPLHKNLKKQKTSCLSKTIFHSKTLPLQISNISTQIFGSGTIVTTSPQMHPADFAVHPQAQQIPQVLWRQFLLWDLLVVLLVQQPPDGGGIGLRQNVHQFGRLLLLFGVDATHHLVQQNKRVVLVGHSCWMLLG